MHAVDIIIPTFNNYEYLQPCINSILSNKVSEGLFHVYVVNNGHEQSCAWINNKDVTVINSGKNLGWEGALKLALEKTSAPYVLFLNDDTYIPTNSRFWLNKMLQHFIDPKIGAVGPASNVVMGFQNIFSQTVIPQFYVKFLIGFCFLTKREAILKAGGIDDTLPGGDDLDMSIRLRQAGYDLVADKDVFVYHHGFKTGSKVYGDAQRRNGWNSYEMLEKTNTALIKKHGFATWWDTQKGAWEFQKLSTQQSHDTEGDLIRDMVKGKIILDLGCGQNKTLPEAIGVDMIPKDEVIETLTNSKSSADVVADITQPLPFEEKSVDTIIARHILEHLMDSVTVLRHWRALLRINGRLIIAVPNNEIMNSIPMNIEHVHGFSKESLKNILELTGFEVVEQLDGGNNISFVTVAERIS